MTKLMEQVVERIASLPESEQDLYAAILTAEIDDVPVPQWHFDVLAERDAAAAGTREDGISLANLAAYDAGASR